VSCKKCLSTLNLNLCNLFIGLSERNINFCGRKYISRGAHVGLPRNHPLCSLRFISPSHVPHTHPPFVPNTFYKPLPPALHPSTLCAYYVLLAPPTCLPPIHPLCRLRFISLSHVPPTQRRKPSKRMPSYTSSAILIA